MKRTLIVLAFALASVLELLALQKADTPNDIQKACIQKDPDLSIASCTKMIQTGRLKEDDLGAAYFIRGMAYEGKKDYEHALADYSESLRLNPGNGVSLRHRGTLYGRQGDYDHAIEDLEQSLKAHPNDPQTVEVLVIAYNNRGLRYGNKNEYDRAVQDFDKALALHPGFTESLNNRAAYAARKGDYDRAIQDLEQVLRQLPNDPRTLSSLVIAYNARASSYEKNGDYSRAIGDYDHAINYCNELLRLNPNDAEIRTRLAKAYNYRGIAFGGRGEVDRASQDIDRALALDPGSVEALSNRGGIRLDAGNYDLAIQDFDQALRLNPKLVGTLLGRGVAYFKKHDLDRAIKDYEEALRLDPSNADVMNQLNKARADRGDFLPSATAKKTSEAPPTEHPGHPALAVKNLLAFQLTFAALKSNGSYRGGFEWPGFYEISNPGDKTVTITDFRVLWRPTSFEGRPLKLVTRSKPGKLLVSEDLDALIKSQQEKADPASKQFPISIPPHTTRYLIVHFLLDVLSGERESLEFRDEKEAYRLLSVALGWKPGSDGTFECLADDVEVEISTAGQQRLKFEPRTGLFVPGCAIRMPAKQEKPLAIQNPAMHSVNEPTRSSLDFTSGKSQVPAGLSTDDYTKLILREPSNADAFNERGKTYRVRGEYDRAIQDFTEAIHLRPALIEAQKNLEEAKRAKAKAVCGFQLFCKN